MPTNQNLEQGSLYVVATPIGNLEDITLRALRILQEADFIAAEDTRHTKKLLNHYAIHTKLISYYRENENQRAEDILELLAKGMNIALVSDAGTPGISDPGAVVVTRARDAGFTIVPIPGPSAMAAALSCSGIADGKILFLGFAPVKQGQRQQVLRSLIHTDYHALFYESPRRVQAFVEDAFAVLGDRRVFLARELTKSFEETTSTTLAALLEKSSFTKDRGEYVIILFPGEKPPPDKVNIDELLLWYRDQSGLSLKDSCKIIAEDLGLSRSKIYQRAIRIWQTSGDMQ